MSPYARRVVIVLAACVAIMIVLLVFAGCGDKDRIDTDIDDADADLITVPWTLYVNYDEHPNVAARCDGTTRMYTTTRGSAALIVVPTSPECQSGDG